MNWTETTIDRMYGLIGERVRLERGHRQMTQAELAMAAGLTRSSIANIEAGRQRTQVHNLFMITKALGVKMQDLLPEESEIVANEQSALPRYDLSGQPDSTQDFINEAVRRTVGK